MKKNKYQHAIDLKPIQIRNTDKATFISQLECLEYRGYEVERLSNGNRIVITKPGSKSVYGYPKKEDFLVFIFYPEDNGLWQISHNQIYEDIVEKSKEDKLRTISLICLLERVCNGEEPNDFIDEISALQFQTGETAETLLKVYKWIWGQEDVNYPNGEGRMLSWKAISNFRDTLK
jgi:hypothetical protein